MYFSNFRDNWWYTWRCMKTTEPRSRHVPPWRSTWSIRRICKNRMPLMAEVANTWPLLPTDKTTMDATTTIKSEKKKWEKYLMINTKKNIIAINSNVSNMYIIINRVIFILSIKYNIIPMQYLFILIHTHWRQNTHIYSNVYICIKINIFGCLDIFD